MNTHSSATPQGTPEKPIPDSEGSDVNVRGILIFLGLLVITGVLIHLALYFMQRQFRKDVLQVHERAKQQQPVATVSRNAPNFPGPRLQLSPTADMKDLHAREEALLNSYGWINKTSGVVRIPIQRAMEILAQNGLPESNNANPPKSSLDLIRERSQKK